MNESTCCDFLLKHSLCCQPKQWMQALGDRSPSGRRKQIILSIIALISGLCSFIMFWICFGFSFVYSGIPPTPPCPGLWTSIMSMITCFYASYETYFLKENIKWTRYKYGFHFRMAFVTCVVILTFLITISSIFLRPFVVWYLVPSIFWLIGAIIAFISQIMALKLGIINNKNVNNDSNYNNTTSNGMQLSINNRSVAEDEESNKHNSENSENNENNENRNKNSDCCGGKYGCLSKCCGKTKLCCKFCCLPITTCIISLLICIQVITSAIVPDMPGKLYTLKDDRDGADSFSYQVQAKCDGIRNNNANGYNFTIILLHGGGSNYLSMTSLMDNYVANGFRVCSYTRSSYAWSTQGYLPRKDSIEMKDLYKLLTDNNKLNEEGPYLIIGHSVGGQLAKEFAYLYPNITRGIILLDSVPGIEWQMIDSSGENGYWTDFKQETKEWYSSVTSLLYIMKLLQPLGALKLIISYPSDYPNKYQESQAWTQGLDAMWDSQYLAMAYATNNFDAVFDREQLLMKGYILGDIPLLSIPAGMNATCDDFGYSGTECDVYLNKNEQFIEMHENQANTSMNGSILVCPYPCDHAFAWTEADWIVNKTLNWFNDINL